MPTLMTGWPRLVRRGAGGAPAADRSAPDMTTAGGALGASGDGGTTGRNGRQTVAEGEAHGRRLQMLYTGREGRVSFARDTEGPHAAHQAMYGGDSRRLILCQSRTCADPQPAGMTPWRSRSACSKRPEVREPIPQRDRRLLETGLGARTSADAGGGGVVICAGPRAAGLWPVATWSDGNVERDPSLLDDVATGATAAYRGCSPITGVHPRGTECSRMVRRVPSTTSSILGGTTCRIPSSAALADARSTYEPAHRSGQRLPPLLAGPPQRGQDGKASSPGCCWSGATEGVHTGTASLHRSLQDSLRQRTGRPRRDRPGPDAHYDPFPPAPGTT